MTKKIHFIIDNTDKAKSPKNKIKKIYKNYSLKKCETIVVLGGDGFMLQTLKKYQKYNKPFYGMNRGTFGFLMNKFKLKNIQKSISKSKLVSISPLEVKVTTYKNKILTAFAINEVSLFRQSRQTASLQVFNGKKILIKKLLSDGVLVSTPAGSTAYNLSVHGPILSIDSKKIAVTPISPFRPRRWKGKIIPSSSIIKVVNLNIKKRPVSAVVDNIEFRNIKKVIIKTNNLIKFKLLYDKNNSLTKKIKLEQIRKQTI
jgi:NAD+ kinase